MHHCHRSSAHPETALGTTKLLRRRRRLPKSIFPHSNPDPSVYRFSTQIIEDPNGPAGSESPWLVPMAPTDQCPNSKTESFLPFDLENLFSSIFILSLISAVLPGTLPDHSYRDMGFSLLDEMIARGNRVAQLRRSEIELLEELVQPLIRPDTPHREEETGVPLIDSINERIPAAHEQHHGIGPDAEDPSPPLAGTVTVTQEEELLFDWRDFGLSLNHMLSATDELNANSLGPGGAGEELPADLWLWGDG